MRGKGDHLVRVCVGTPPDIMSRTEMAYTDTQLEFLCGHRWAVLATGRLDGSPQQAMVGYALAVADRPASPWPAPPANAGEELSWVFAVSMGHDARWIPTPHPHTRWYPFCHAMARKNAHRSTAGRDDIANLDASKRITIITDGSRSRRSTSQDLAHRGFRAPSLRPDSIVFGHDHRRCREELDGLQTRLRTGIDGMRLRRVPTKRALGHRPSAVCGQLTGNDCNQILGSVRKGDSP